MTVKQLKITEGKSFKSEKKKYITVKGTTIKLRANFI